MRLLLRWIITALALVVAVWLVPGITVRGNAFVALAVTAAVLGLVNTFIKPILSFLSCAFIFLTLGLFLLVINGVMLWLAAYISEHALGVGFHVAGFWPAFWGGLVVSVVSYLLSFTVRESRTSRR